MLPVMEYLTHKKLLKTLSCYWSATLAGDNCLMSESISIENRSDQERKVFIKKEIVSSPLFSIPYSRIENERHELCCPIIRIENQETEFLPYKKYRYQIFTQQKQIICDEYVTFDSSGKIIFTGNMLNFEIVEKMKFKKGYENPAIGFALRDRCGSSIDGVRIWSRVLSKGDLLSGATFDKDGFYNLTCDDHDFNHKTKAQNLLIPVTVYASNNTEKSEVLIRQQSDALFVTGCFADFYDGNVYMPNHIYHKHIPWSLTVFFHTGHSTQILLPKEEEYQFPTQKYGEIIKTVLTDALDNDWETEK